MSVWDVLVSQILSIPQRMNQRRAELRIAIVGSRIFPCTDFDLIASFIDGLPDGSVIVSGGARGVDRIAQKRAEERGFETIIILPNYDQFGGQAPLIRNKEIVNRSDIVVAFWDGRSRGTLHIMKRAEQVGKLVLVVYPRGTHQRELQRNVGSTDKQRVSRNL